MEREKVIELVKQAGDIGDCYCQTIMVNDRDADDWVMAFARLVEKETLERALMECEAMRDDMVKIKCSNQQIYGASQAVETIRSLKLPTN